MPSEVDRYHAGSDWWYPTVKADDGFWVKHSDHLVALKAVEEERDWERSEASRFMAERDDAEEICERAVIRADTANVGEREDTAQIRHERLGHSASPSFTRCPDPGCQIEAAETRPDHSEATPVDTTPGESTIPADSCGGEEADRCTCGHNLEGGWHRADCFYGPGHSEREEADHG